jgi:hypothetical protein
MQIQRWEARIRWWAWAGAVWRTAGWLDLAAIGVEGVDLVVINDDWDRHQGDEVGRGQNSDWELSPGPCLASR